MLAKSSPGKTRATVERMNAAMAHRGPDAASVEELSMSEDWHGAFGHLRLAVIDLSPGGCQPRHLAREGLTLVYNGELYNYRAVRTELESYGRVFESNSDTEVVIQAYAHWGAKCLDRFVGMFALAIWDRHHQELFLARDRFGIKPLYYAASAQSFAFASEVRALIRSDAVPRKLNLAAIPDFLKTGSIVSPATLIEGVVSLPPGTFARWNRGQLVITPYWSITEIARDARDIGNEEFRHLLTTAMRSETVADVPMGVFLSGGVDSSAIVSILASETPSTLRTVALVFDEASLDERQHSAAVAKAFGTDHREVHISADSVSTLLPGIAKIQDQPCVDGLNAYLVSRAAREAGLTVALSGLGGDELFAGYTGFRLARWWDRLGWLAVSLPMPARRNLGAVAARFAGPKAGRIVSEATSVADIYDISREVLSQASIQALRGPALQGNSQNLHTEVDVDDGVRAMTVLESTGYMLDTTLRQADAMSMAVSLEVRVPFLNHPLAEAAIQAPASKKLSWSVPKPLIVNSLERPLPDSVVHRRKGTFTLPFADWLRGPHRSVAEDLLFSQRTRDRGLLNADGAATVWKAFLNKERSGGWARVWALCTLEAWCREYIDG